jgi:hypothetical protein
MTGNTTNDLAPDERTHVVRMVPEHESDHVFGSAAITSIATVFG